jgi:hypothetical protein
MPAPEDVRVTPPYPKPCVLVVDDELPMQLAPDLEPG